MSVEKIIEILKTAIESNDWDLIKELLETLRYEGEHDENDFYQKKMASKSNELQELRKKFLEKQIRKIRTNFRKNEKL